jgi:hypothetical protein
MAETFVTQQRRQQTEVFAGFEPVALMEGWPYRLAGTHASLNLAPAIRDEALAYFATHDIQWHIHANHALS